MSSSDSSLPNVDASTALRQVLQEIGYGVILVDRRGAVRYANSLGRAEFATGQTLLESEGVVVTAIPRQARRLQRALDEAERGRRSLGDFGADRGARTFAFIPLSAAQSEDGGGLVLIICGRSEPFEPLTLLLYGKVVGLTVSERDVLAFLCRGLAAQDIASERHVKLSTVRTQIGSIRDKIGARSVLQIVAKISSLPPVCRLADERTRSHRGSAQSSLRAPVA